MNRKWQELAWGEHLHMGLYEREDDTRSQAMQRATARMAEGLPLDSSSEALEVGCGIGQAARHLAREYGCRVHATNIDEAQLVKARELATEEKLNDLVSFAWGDFHQLDQADESQDLWWCQEAVVHSSDKARVLREAWRVLKPEGIVVLSDLVITDNIEDEVRKRLYSRIPTELIWTKEQYARAIEGIGFSILDYQDWSENVARSYAEARQILLDNKDQLLQSVENELFQETMDLYALWVERAERGQIGWIYYRLQKS